ncbi:TipJ family phage tail tip protein [Methylobacterium oryzisoli]|uniref:TipJ family phage tail tip protein n=1 Tax=Methylobacterium oryzisoli TaxID=3385502 RepID=UPI003891C938
MDSFDRRDPAAEPGDDARLDTAGPIRGAKSSGGGKGGGKSASSAPDTLFSNATIRIVDLLGEGEIKGVVGGLKGVYLNDVPVMNADGSLNFKGIEVDFRNGSPDQPYMPGFPGVETSQDIGTTVRQAVPVTASISDEGADRARVIIEYPALFLAKSDGSVRENVVQFRIEVRYSGGPWVNELGDIQITGKNTSPAFDTFEINLPRNPVGTSSPWQVRVTRITPDTDPFNNSQDKWTSQSDIVFFSLTALQDEKFTYPHSALAGLKADAANFGSSVPARTYLIDGILMPVPSNYDPATRTYTGIWDGTFKEAWSDNPAWAFHLLLENDRFGLGQHIDVAAIDKWSLYEIGRYCDVPVSDGKGGQEPRFTFNGSLYQQDEAFELLQQIAQIFRGMAYWSSGTVTATQDRPADVKALLTPANVIDGEFSYASSARRARHTVAIVSWNDPSNLFKQEIEVVEDPRGVARYGYNPTKIDLLGCTSRGQAYRHGLWTLLTELYETQTVTYRAGLDHAVRRPGDLIAIQDPQVSNLDLGGRLRGGSNASQLLLDRTITLKAGVQYFVAVTLPDGTVVERAIDHLVDGAQLALTNPLPVAPDAAAVWQISGDVLPQTFKIVSIKETEPHIYEVVALEHEPSKYAAVDDGATFVESPISEFPNLVLPPKNVSARPSTYFELNQPRQAILLSWTAGQPFNSLAYYVTALKPNGTLVSLPRTQSLSVEFLDAPSGDWQFVIQTEGLNGRLSEPVIYDFTLEGWEAQAGPTIENLQVKGGGTTFHGRSCTVEWTLAWPEGVTPYDVDYVFRVFDVGTDVLLHQEVLEAAQATYDYDENVNEGGPRRSFRITVAARDAIGREGVPAALVVTNPPPAAVLPTLIYTSLSIGIEFSRPNDPDYAGFLAWVSKDAGFNPLTTPPTHDAIGSFLLVPAEPDTTYYIRVAPYDLFGKNPAELNISAEQSIRTQLFPVDTTAPDIPTGVVLTTKLVTSATGVSTSEIEAGWNPVTSDNFGFYEAEILEGDLLSPLSTWGQRQFLDAERSVWRGLKPGVSYSVRVRAVNDTRFAWSGWSVIQTIIAAKNTTKPGAITGFTATGAVDSAALDWVNPSNNDLAYVEVWAGGETASVAQATLLDKVPVPLASYFDQGLRAAGVRRYWVRPVNSSGTVGDYVGPQTAQTLQIQKEQIANGVIDATKFAANIAKNLTVDTLPTTKVAEYVTLSTNGLLYRWDPVAGAYTSSVGTVKAGDITGTITAAQIASLRVDQLTGQLTDAQVAGLTATKLIGQLTDAQIAGLSAAKLTGQITRTQITDGAVSTPKLEAGAVTTDKVFAGAITASKITLADISNMVMNGDFSSGNADGWTATAAGAYSYVENSGVSTDVGGYFCFRSNFRDQAMTNWISGQEDEIIYVSAMVHQQHASRANLLVHSVDGAGNNTPTNSLIYAAFTDVKSTWVRIEGRVKLPPGTQKFRLWLQNERTAQDNTLCCFWGKVQARRAASAQMIVDGAIIADKLAANSVTASKLAIASANLAYNPDFSQGMRGWSLYVGNTTVSATTLQQPYIDQTWAPSGFKAIGVLHRGNPGTKQWGFYNTPINAAGGAVDGYTVTEGVTYEFSAFISNHRCRAQIYVDFVDGTGVYKGTYIASLANGAGGGAGGSPATYPSVKLIVKAPAGAVRAYVYFMGIDATAADPYLFVSGFMMAATYVGATETSPYVAPGLTTIDGTGIISNSLNADRIVAGSIGAREIAANSITANKLTMASRSIQTAGFNFRYERAINRLQWDQGWIYYPDDAGVTQGVNVAAGYIDNASSTWGSLNWSKGATGITWSNNLNYAQEAGANWMCLVAWDGSGLDIKHGNTIIDGGRVVANSIHGDKITAGSIAADRLVANSITAGQISAGAIGVNQLAAGAITADKLGVGLATTNQFANSDFQANIIGVTGSWWSDNIAPTLQWNADWAPVGLNDVMLYRPDTPGNGVVADWQMRRRTQDSWAFSYPAAAGQYYEASSYVSTHRCKAQVLIQFLNAAEQEVGLFFSNVSDDQQVGRATTMNNWPRLVVKGQAPATAFYVRVIFRTTFKGIAQPYSMWSGIYLGSASPNQTQWTPWSRQAATVIDGGSLATNSLHADRIIAGSITADKIAGSTITGDKIAGRSISAGHVVAGQIWAEHIAAGNITADKLAVNAVQSKHVTVNSRGLVVRGCDFQVNRNNNTVSWSDGHVLWTDDNGNPAATYIAAGSVGWGGWVSIGWWKGAGYLDAYNDTNGGWTMYLNHADRVIFATFTGGSTGLVVTYGGTILDGDKITAGSITASRIAAGQINAGHIGAGQITAEKIGAGQVTADKIGAGTITAGNIMLGNHRFVLEAYGGGSIYRRMYIRDDNDNLRAMFGYIGDFATGERSQAYGLVLWDPWGTQIFNGGGYHGGAVWTRSLGAHSIVANAITTNEITTGKLIVNGHIYQQAVTQVVYSSTGGQGTFVDIYVRESGTPLLVQGYSAGTNGVPIVEVGGGGRMHLFQEDLGRGGGPVIIATIFHTKSQYVQGSYIYTATVGFTRQVMEAGSAR